MAGLRDRSSTLHRDRATTPPRAPDDSGDRGDRGAPDAARRSPAPAGQQRGRTPIPADGSPGELDDCALPKSVFTMRERTASRAVSCGVAGWLRGWDPLGVSGGRSRRRLASAAPMDTPGHPVRGAERGGSATPSRSTGVVGFKSGAWRPARAGGGRVARRWPPGPTPRRWRCGGCPPARATGGARDRRRRPGCPGVQRCDGAPAQGGDRIRRGPNPAGPDGHVQPLSNAGRLRPRRQPRGFRPHRAGKHVRDAMNQKAKKRLATDGVVLEEQAARVQPPQAVVCSTHASVEGFRKFVLRKTMRLGRDELQREHHVARLEVHVGNYLTAPVISARRRHRGARTTRAMGRARGTCGCMGQVWVRRAGVRLGALAKDGGGRPARASRRDRGSASRSAGMRLYARSASRRIAPSMASRIDSTP